MLTASSITLQFSTKPLFENVNVKFGDGNRYGLIGANGCGKSTFMRILAGELESTAGNISLDPGERMAWLRQDQFGYEDMRVLDVVLQGHAEMWRAMTEKDAIYMNPEASEDDYLHAAELEAQFGEMGGYDAEARAGELLHGAGIPTSQHNGLMSEIAPGFKLRVLLAQALFSKPDYLLLDEPTNNLDINTIRWLEEVLNNSSATIIVISHDRHFLNQVCTHMADLDFNTIKVWPGNYDDYMLASVQAKERQAAANARAKEKVADLQEFVRRFSANASKARQATSRQKQLEKIKIEDFKPSSRQNPYIRFEQEKPLHRRALEVENLKFGYEGGTLFSNLNFSLEAGEKLAVIGGNGVGKSTLMKLLMGELQPDFGEIRWSENANTGYFSQDHVSDFDTDDTLTDWMHQWAQQGDDEQVLRGILGRLLFSGDDVKKSVRVLSGGEKGRMLYGKLMLGRHNVLVMDEPTNHMDMESIESLNLALDLYKGTLIFVSHDRAFVSSLATRILEITPDGVEFYMGTYDEYLHSKGLE
ncbi:MAG: ABC-F family ATPase [Hydrogenophilales bacterium 16-64-46]|nr:MAG: ABC-F family ATPase [Hydrogenophilales bacterium 12-64-13]OYZ06628.1 MAG: ABC-F family ATPase [Hydrogenophilales bacterium 16-64-46]OZA39336.1 MAG: ABC-F family ATPase [Hydrogenophilales bacterium 17-64-34]HQS98899.1 ABC-F family ATPase [Thiobacillus sp.]